MSFEILTTAQCRWSIRNIVALREKGLDFHLVNVAEGGRKADWYAPLTPFGRTPALRHGADIIVESRVINEYLEEVAPGRPLLPAHPLKRAWARIWNGYCDEELMKHVHLAVSSDSHASDQGLRLLDAALDRLERNVFVHAEFGSFWGGQELSLTDICYWTLFDTLERVDQLASAKRLLNGRSALRGWSERVRACPRFEQAAAELEALGS